MKRILISLLLPHAIMAYILFLSGVPLVRGADLVMLASTALFFSAAIYVCPAWDDKL